jgi:4-diphosphocytidyl-2C-methyl-D-erythritol 2-phosphate synthase
VRVRRTSGSRAIDITGLPDNADIGPAERNLAWRAAEAYLAAARWTGGFAIELEKRIPIGGGLGGGSADAGAVLRALDALSPNPLGQALLLRIASPLGADVPFLASEHAFALGWGRGERLLALPTPPRRSVVLLVPAFSVNTGAAYGWLAEARAITGESLGAGVLDVGAMGEWDGIIAVAGNDFEPVVAAHRPESRASSRCSGAPAARRR